MTRPTLESIYMDLALSLSFRSTCQRLQVGTVIASLDLRKILAVGYNGNAAGLTNGCDHPHTPGACGCLHSEENAVIACDCPRSEPKLIFVTHLPCAMCAKRLVNLGNVRKVYYSNSYRTETSKEIFQQTGIALEKMELTL